MTKANKQYIPTENWPKLNLLIQECLCAKRRNLFYYNCVIKK